jgi:hypothetical protein
MTVEPTLDKATLEDVLNELALLARADGKVIEVAIYGGAALTLVSNFRITTRDVDAVADDDGQQLIERYATVIAARRGWPENWLNDQVFPFLSDKIDGLATHHDYVRSFPSEHEPGLRVFVPTAEYLLAMKLMAMRIGADGDAKDRADILGLLPIVGLLDGDATMAFLSSFYPEAQKSAKVARGIDELFATPTGVDHTDVLAPRYLGRSGPPDDRG